jgi:ATP-dependent protease HslVU (ClpYQ) peptidase subunit
MTIAISLKVNDGVVLAADSAASIISPPVGKDPGGVINVYQNAEKVFNLCKGKPIGSITWGSGSIGLASISTLMKDFRKVNKLKLHEENLKVQEVTEELAKFFHTEKYVPAYESWPDVSRPAIGFIVAGYSDDESFAEEWKFEIIKGKLIGPERIRTKEEAGLMWNGEPEAISRLILGISPNMHLVLRECGVDDEMIGKIIKKSNERLSAPIIIAPMPIKDAIDVAEFLVQTTINFSKFTPGAPTVGGPIDIAAITKHEGFKWIKRKHYYNSDINPKESGE